MSAVAPTRASATCPQRRAGHLAEPQGGAQGPGQPRQGWAGLDAYGGRDASLWEWLVFEEEHYQAGAPPRVTRNGIFLLAPSLFESGTRVQQDALLPRMAGTDDLWCQGWSEPDPGSDLASLSSRARRVDGGDEENRGEALAHRFVKRKTDAGSGSVAIDGRAGGPSGAAGLATGSDVIARDGSATASASVGSALWGRAVDAWMRAEASLTKLWRSGSTPAPTRSSGTSPPSGCSAWPRG